MATVEVRFNGATIQQQVLNKDVAVIGRQEGCEVRIDNLGISRSHARFVRDGTGYIVEDLNSSNGTFVNGEQVQRHRLNDGDEIAVGKYLLIYREVGDERETVAIPKTPSEAAVAAVPGADALNTMAMDGNVIRKRIEALHQQKMQESQAEPEPVAQQTPTRMADAEVRAHEAELRMLRESQRRTQTLLIALGVLAVAAVAGLVFFLTR